MRAEFLRFKGDEDVTHEPAIRADCGQSTVAADEEHVSWLDKTHTHETVNLGRRRRGGAAGGRRARREARAPGGAGHTRRGRGAARRGRAPGQGRAVPSSHYSLRSLSRTSRAFYFPDSRDLLEVLRGLLAERERETPGRIPEGPGGSPRDPPSLSAKKVSENKREQDYTTLLSFDL